MYYKARQQKRNGKWYPQSVLHGRAVTTKQLCDDTGGGCQILF